MFLMDGRTDEVPSRLSLSLDLTLHKGLGGVFSTLRINFYNLLIATLNHYTQRAYDRATTPL